MASSALTLTAPGPLASWRTRSSGAAWRPTARTRAPAAASASTVGAPDPRPAANHQCRFESMFAVMCLLRLRRRSRRAKRCAGGARAAIFCAARGHLGLDCGGRSDDTPVVDRARRWLRIFALLCAVVGVYARTAQAAPVSARELRARQDFAAGRYEEAIEIFAELYAKTADPIFLRNIARCYQKQNRADEAIANFREYLSKAKKLSPGEKEEIEGYIRDLEASRAPPKPAEPREADRRASRRARAGGDRSAAREATRRRPTRRRARARRPPRRAGARAACAGEVATRTPAEESPRDAGPHEVEPARARRRLGVLPGVVLTAAGVAAIGGGVAFGLAARSAATAVASQYDPNRESAGKRDATLQWVGYGVGAAALVTGVILLVRGPGEPEASSSSVQVGFVPRRRVAVGAFLVKSPGRQDARGGTV